MCSVGRSVEAHVWFVFIFCFVRAAPTRATVVVLIPESVAPKRIVALANPIATFLLAVLSRNALLTLTVVVFCAYREALPITSAGNTIAWILVTQRAAVPILTHTRPFGNGKGASQESGYASSAWTTPSGSAHGLLAISPAETGQAHTLPQTAIKEGIDRTLSADTIRVSVAIGVFKARGGAAFNSWHWRIGCAGTSRTMRFHHVVWPLLDVSAVMLRRHEGVPTISPLDEERKGVFNAPLVLEMVVRKGDDPVFGDVSAVFQSDSIFVVLVRRSVWNNGKSPA